MQVMIAHEDFEANILRLKKNLTIHKEQYQVGDCEIRIPKRPGVAYYSARITSVLELTRDERNWDWWFESVEGERKPISLFYEKLGFESSAQMRNYYWSYLARCEVAYLHCFYLNFKEEV